MAIHAEPLISFLGATIFAIPIKFEKQEDEGSMNDNCSSLLTKCRFRRTQLQEWIKHSHRFEHVVDMRLQSTRAKVVAVFMTRCCNVHHVASSLLMFSHPVDLFNFEGKCTVIFGPVAHVHGSALVLVAQCTHYSITEVTEQRGGGGVGGGGVP